MLNSWQNKNEVATIFYMSDGMDTCDNSQENILSVLSNIDL